MSEILKGLAEEKARDRGRWWILGVVMVIASVGLVALVLLYDDPPADDAWMLPKITEVPESENALARFCHEVEGEKLNGTMPVAVKVVDASNEADVRAFVEGNAVMRGKMDALLATDQSLWRWPVEWDHLTASMPFPGLARAMEIVNVMRLEGLLLVHQGRFAEAAEIAGKVRRLGIGFQKAEGMMLHWMVAVAVRMIGVDTMEAVAKAPGVDAALLLKMQEEVQPDWAETSKALAFAFRAEYFFSKELEDPNQEVALGMLNHDWERFAVKWLQMDNRSMNLYLEWQRPLVKALDEGSESDFVRARSELQDQLEQLREKKWKLLLNANAGGYVLLLKSFSTFNTLHHRSIILLTRERLFHTMLLLRFYDLKHGKLPETLGELSSGVSELTSRSIDPFDGNPLRWDVKKRVLYSVSENGRDDGGKVGEALGMTEQDYGSHYWWDEKVE